MPQSLARILLHLVFSTKHRAPLIPGETAADLHSYLAAIAGAQGCHAYRVGGTENHVHLCCLLGRTQTCAKLIEQLKTGSSSWMKAKVPPTVGFTWQNGYGAFSIAEDQLRDLCEYIEDQRQHHAEVSFEEEFRELLRRYHVAYDDRYVWE